MTIRLLASYQFIDKDGQAGTMVRLPVVGYAPPDEDGRERPRVLLLSGDDPHLIDFHSDSTVETQYGNLEALLIDYPVLAWEPEPQTSFDDYPQGHAVLLIPDRDDDIGSHSGPVSTRDLPGQARYRRDPEHPQAPR